MVKIKNRILSPTAINTYLSCPRKFYLRYFKRLKTRPSIHLIRGQIVHQTLERFYKARQQILTEKSEEGIQKALLAIFKSLWNGAGDRLNALGLNDEEICFYYTDSELMLCHFGSWFCKNNLPMPDLTETRIFSKNLSIMGIIDAVYENQDGTILVDYKTSKHVKITEDIKRQAAIYGLLYQDRYNKMPAALWVHFLKDAHNPVPIHIDEVLLDYGKMLIQSIREKTLSQDEVDYQCTCGGFCERDFVTS